LNIDQCIRLAQYLEKQKELSRSKKEKIKKKIEKALKEAPKQIHRFDDPTFFEDTEKIQEGVKQAVQQGK
jgi:ElaB/YqjD/DUF883 family membrane-anchored ribosome-binding protein